MPGRPVEPEDALFLELPDDILDSPFAQTGQASDIGIPSAVDPFPALRSFGIFGHQTVNGILAGCQPVSDAAEGAQLPRRSDGCDCSNMFYRLIVFYPAISGYLCHCSTIMDFRSGNFNY